MRALVLCLAVLAVGCPDRSISPVDPVPTITYTKEIPVSADLDILFVIDNSQSTKDKQTTFARNYKHFVTAIDRFPGGRPNVHLGVVTSSVDVGVAGFGAQCHPASGQNGLLQNVPHDPTTCVPPTTARFLSDIQQPGVGHVTNYTGELETALSCISQAGEAGCGFEAPLEAMKRALDGSRRENDGFLRPGAFLAVVFLTDEDDCSGDPTTSIRTGVLAPPFPQTLSVLSSCDATIEGQPAIARPALRLDSFLDNFGDRGLFRTVCQADYSQALDDIGALLFRAISPCLEGKLDTDDTDPDMPGLQPDCSVSELQDPDTDKQIEALISRCAMAAEDQPAPGDGSACWWVNANAARCSTETHLELHVQRAASPPPNTTVRVSCAIAGS